jgi:hypothetical protein
MDVKKAIKLMEEQDILKWYQFFQYFKLEKEINKTILDGWERIIKRL